MANTVSSCATRFLSSAETQILATISSPWVKQSLFQSHVVFCVQTPLSVIRSGSSSNATSVAWAVTGTSSSPQIHIDSQPRPDGFSDVVISSDDGSMSMTLDPVCTFTLLYPQAKLSQARREELSLVGSQFWFYGLAVFAIVFESIPHILALLIARLIATGWSTYALWRTTNIRDRMFHLIEKADTPCHFDLYSQYFVRRFALQLADLVLHLDALLISTYLSWRLYKLYRTHTFRRVGPPKNVLRMYGYFLAVLVSIQLSTFTLVNAMALWVDQLLHGAIKDLSLHTPVYNGTFILTIVLLIPWLMMGWYSCFAVVCARNYDKGLAQWCKHWFYIRFLGDESNAGGTVYVEKNFGDDDFEPDLFPTEVTEEEWKHDGDRASIYKVALPDLLRADPAPVV
ncbi:hypothetical protein EDB86DRAFT_3073024 [Lactarius hatsudake]|nr:hypothetical protein EDB86DRAFT_3073024 [Lactarius hatsudake]